MYVGLKQPRGDGERYVTPARARCEGDYCLTDLHFIHTNMPDNLHAL